MSRLQSLKDLIYQRLTAAVDEIIGHLEQTITEYEEAMECCQRELLDTGSKPEEKMQSADFSADVLQLLIKEEPQEQSPGLAQEHPKHTDVKKEKDDILEFPFARVPVKSDDDEEKPQSSQLLQRQTEDTNREAEPPASSSSVQMETEADGRDHTGSELDRSVVSLKCPSQSNDKTSHFSVAVARSGDDWMEVKKPQTDLITMNNKVLINDTECHTGNKSFSCSKCGKRFGQKHHLQTHMRLHTGEKPFSCPLCDKRFTQKGNLKQHMIVHTREKPCSCSVCGERFAQQGHLTQHMTVHTREKLCCSQISKGH